MTLDEDFKKTDSESVKLSDQEIFIKIWSSPRLVFKYLTEYRYDKYLYVLLALGGISKAFDRASLKSTGDTLSLPVILGLCIILGASLGWITYYLYAAAMSWTGKWLQGKGNTSSLLRVLAYSAIPSIIATILFLPQIVMFGVEIFQSDFDASRHGSIAELLYYLLTIVEVILGLWTAVLAVIGISEVQQLSIGKSILNVILPIVVILVPILIIIFLLIDLFGR
jgi:hypothetical protein